MLVYILDEYKNRTEYKLLGDFYECQTVKMNLIKTGVIVLPGILLYRMSEEQLNQLNIWLEDKRNQLILTPAWAEMNLKHIFNASVDIVITKTDSSLDEIPVGYRIDTTVKDIIFNKNGKNFGIHYRKNTGTGLITVVTLPLLDYKLIQFSDKQKVLFDSLFQAESIVQESKVETRDFDLGNIHIYLLILLGAKVDLGNEVSEKVYKYIGVKVDEKSIEESYNELVSSQHIENCSLTEKGMYVVRERKLKSFIQTVKQRGEKEDGWI